MLVFIWAALLFVSASHSNTDNFRDDKEPDDNGRNLSTTTSRERTSARKTVTQIVTSTTMAQSEVNNTTTGPGQALNYTTDGHESVSSSDTNRNASEPTGYSDQGDLLTKLLTTVKQPQVIIAFFIGVLLSAIICCLITKFNRKKRRGSRKVAESLKMVTTQAVPLMHDGDDGAHGAEGPDGEAGGPKEVEYSNIDFSALKRRSPTEAEETQDPTETEYAEIKKDAPVEGEDTAGEESEAVEGNKEEGAITGEEKNEKEPEQCEPAKDKGGEDVAVYSNVYEVMVESDGGDTLTDNS